MRANLSFWEKDSFYKDIDYAVIGSGIVGLNAAITLKENHPHDKVVIFERGTLPSGAATRNAGFACFGSLTELIADLEKENEEKVFALVGKRLRGLARLRERCGDENIQFQKQGGIEVFQAEEEVVFQECKDKIAWFNDKIKGITGNIQTYKVIDERIRKYGFSQVSHLILNQEEGQIHTGLMVQRLVDLALTKGVRIFNGADIKKIEENADAVTLITENETEIQVGRLLIAVNGFAKKLMPDLAVTPARNQVILTNPIKNLPFQGCFHYDQGYFYFRNIGDRVLLGGGRNFTPQAEVTTQFGQTKIIQKSLLGLLKEVILPGRDYIIEHKWSGILGIGDSKTPIVKKISDKIGVAVRLGGMGVAIGSLVGEEAAQLFD